MVMNAAELAGQSLMFRFEGPEFTDEAKRAFRELRPCGVLFFADNITSREQVHALTSELQDEARQLGLPPLLIAADQEGGIISRLPADFVTQPGAMALAASSDPAHIETAARITGEQLREVGIAVNFAPAVDVNNNPDNSVIRTRAFGDSPDAVIASLERAFRGHEAARVVTTVKHFPGHGDTGVDSHLGLPTIPFDRSRIERVELAPFRAAAKIGVPAVMSAHILFPALDPDYPATLSERILTGLLRGEMGFTGVTFTDSMSMRAISERYGVEESTVLAKLAGVDVLEANESLADQQVRHAALVEAMESGRIPIGMFEATVDRLQALRYRYEITGEPVPMSDPPRERYETILGIAERTIAHRGVGAFRPLGHGDGVAIIDFQRFRTTEAEDPVGRAQVLRDAAARHLTNADIVTLSNDPTQDEIDGAVAQVRTAETVVILTRDASDLPEQVQIANGVIASAPAGIRVIHCPMRGPYDAGVLDRADDLLFTFGDPAVSIQALVRVLGGNADPVARMPVDVPTLAHAIQS